MNLNPGHLPTYKALFPVLRTQTSAGISGVPIDKVEAAKWVRKCAEQEDGFCQWLLASMYADGEGVPKDYKQTMNWMRKLADTGNAYFQYSLGQAYKKGEVVSKDYVQALMWFNIAASQGFEEAKTESDEISKLMTPSQIKEAQRLAREWKPKK